MRHATSPLVRALLAAIAAVALVACGDGEEPVATSPRQTTSTVTETTAVGGERARLDQARERWSADGPEDYRLTWTAICFCPRATFVDTIVGGRVVEHRMTDGSEAVQDPGGKTMETLFDEVEEAISSDPASLTVDYDEDTGAVARYYVDIEANMADEEYGIEAAVTALDEEPATDDVALAELTDSYPCGHGFQAGRPDQEVGLFARVRAGADPSGTVNLPAEDWDVTIRFGRALFANWCDDVQDPGEPTSVVTETWPVVAGTLTVTGPAGGQYGPATMEATGLVAERPDGERVPLGDITVTNDSYGLVPG